MAKFKIGDVVSVKREAAEMIDNPALARKRGRVTKVLPGGYYEVDGELGATGLELTDAELTLANSRACNGVRSRNSVVANALNACGTARNADGDLESYFRLAEWQKANSNLSQAWKLVNATIPLYKALASKAPDAEDKRDAQNSERACYDILGKLNELGA